MRIERRSRRHRKGGRGGRGGCAGDDVRVKDERTAWDNMIGGEAE